MGKILEARKRILGEDHIDTLRSMSCMAWAYGEQGRLADATNIYEKVRKRDLGDEYIETLRSMSSLAWAYGEQGLVEEAVRLYEEVVEAMARVLGSEHQDTLKAQQDMERMYERQDNAAGVKVKGSGGQVAGAVYHTADKQ
jgi:tetratricopeptide (TPR) repeat protein